MYTIRNQFIAKGFRLFLLAAILSSTLGSSAAPVKGSTTAAEERQLDGQHAGSVVTPSILKPYYGRVVDEHGLPRSGLRVQIISAHGSVVDEAISEADGEYRIYHLPQTPFTFRVYDPSGRSLELLTFESGIAQLAPVASRAGLELNGRSSPTATFNKNSGNEAANGQISGALTAADSGLPVDDALVWLREPDGDSLDLEYVNSRGLYTFTDVTPGPYIVQFQPFGDSSTYLPEFYDNKPDRDSADVINVSESEILKGIDATLEKGGQISGTVTAEGTDLPLADVRVTAYFAGKVGDPCPNGDPQFDFDFSTTTDENGHYTLKPLRSGIFRLLFAPNSSGASSAYFPEYYNNKGSLAEADPISLTAPNIESGINAKLALGAIVTGKVTAANTGQPLEDISIRVYDSSGSRVGDAFTNASGLFTTTALLAGSYRVEFEPFSFGDNNAYLAEYYDNSPDLDGATPIDVKAGATIENINAVLDRGGQIAGLVTAEGTGTPLDDIFVEIYDSSHIYTDFAFVNADGAYETSGLPSGDYHLEFDAFSFGDDADYISEFYNDKPNLDSSDAVKVTAPNITTGINAQLALGGSISGIVTVEGDGAPIQDVLVIAYDSDGRFLKSTTTDASGFYIVPGLATGGYRLQFSYTLPRDDCDTVSKTISEYYNNKSSLESADVIQVTAPQAMEGINVSMLLPLSSGTYIYLPTVIG